jgi:hypothetical protein
MILLIIAIPIAWLLYKHFGIGKTLLYVLLGIFGMIVLLAGFASISTLHQLHENMVANGSFRATNDPDQDWMKPLKVLAFVGTCIWFYRRHKAKKLQSTLQPPPVVQSPVVQQSIPFQKTDGE